MRATAKRLRGYANDSANLLAGAFGATPNAAGAIAAAQMNTNGAGIGARPTVVNHNYALSPEDLMRVLKQCGQGAAAHDLID